MFYEFRTKEKIKSCNECPCNFLDGHQNYCKLASKFNITKDSTECPLTEYEEKPIIGGTD